MKKVMSLLLALVMALSLLPTAVWAEENDALKTIDVGGRTVYFASGMSGGYLQGGGNVQTGSWGNEDIPAFVFRLAAGAGGYCHLAVNKAAFTNGAPTLTYQVAGDTGAATELTATNTNEQEKYVYQLTVPEVEEGEVTYLFNLPRDDSSSDKFALVFGKAGEGSSSDSGGGNDGGDNIGEFECQTVGKDWDGETDLQNMVITSLRNMTGGREFIELGVDWRQGEIGAVQNVGIPNEVLQEMAAANKPVLLYGAWGTNMTIPAAAVKDMADQLANMNKAEGEKNALLWLKLEYHNFDGPEGNACAFRMRVFLGETHYELPRNLAYTFQLSGEINDHTAFKLYCPEDQDEVGTALVEQGSAVSYRDETGGSNSWRMYEFKANHDGMFVIARVDYNANQNWPWSGVPQPKWQAGEKVYPTQATGYLKTLYDVGYTFPKMNVDLHFQFPDALKEWTPGCGDDWDYKMTWDDNTGVVTVEVNGANKQRWIEAVRDPDNGSELMGGVFFFFYIGNSDTQKPTKYGMELCGEYEYISQLENAPVTPLATAYYYSNGFQLADVNRENALKSTLTINSSGETWFHALALDEDDSKTMQDAAHKFALVVEIKPTENYAYSIRVDNGTPVEKERIHAAATNTDWTTEPVTEDAMVIMKTVNTDMEDAETDRDMMIGNLTVVAPAGYKLAKWWSAQEGRKGTSFPVRISNYLSQRIMLQWENENDPTDTKLEYVKLECHNSQPYFALVRDPNTPSTPATPVFTVSETDMKNNGVDVKYDPKTGYFSTTINAANLKDLSVLDGAVTVQPMKGAVKYKWLAPGGSQSPAMLGQQDADTLFSRFVEVEAEEIADGGQLPSVPLMVVSEMDLGNGTKVYYADSQLYRGLLVQWLDKADNVLGYSYLYGHNGDLVTAVKTDCVSAAPKTEVSMPTIVGSDTGEFLCNVDPQSSSDAYTKFFRFSVENEDAIGSDGVTIYLPYSDFGMTAEQGLALAAKGIKPLIWHYLNESCTEEERIEGEYTEVGIKFVTYGFSPFLITAVQTAGGSTGGNTGNGGSSGGGGSTGGSTSGTTGSSAGPQGWVLKTSDKAASATDYSGGIYGLTFRSSASFASFRGVQVDGKTVAAENYIAEANGGIEVYLKAAYLKALKAGKHTVTILSSEGNVSMEFTIGGVNTSAATGDSSNLPLWSALLLASTLTLAGAVHYKRKRAR